MAGYNFLYLAINTYICIVMADYNFHSTMPNNL